MSRPRHSDPSLMSRHPSPTTLANATAEQAASSIPREAALQDGVLLVLSYEGDNIFVLSNSSYEHVLDSALANFNALRSSRIERSRLRLALQTTIGTTVTLVHITPDTWPAVATRARVVTVILQRPPSPSTQPSPSSHPKLAPPVSYRPASPREPEPSAWQPNSPSPRQTTTWHPAYPSVYPPSASRSMQSPGRDPPRSLAHPSHPSHVGSSSSHSYAHMHYIPATPNVVSPTVDAAFLGVRPPEPEPRQDRRESLPSGASKRRWAQVDDSSADERPPHPRPGPDAPVRPTESAQSREFNTQAQHTEDNRKVKRTRAWNPPDHQYSCRRCHRTDSPAWRKGPEGPKTLCNACGLSYAKEIARREAAASAAPASTQPASPPERSAGYGYSSGSTASNSRSARTVGVKTLDGSGATLSMDEGSFPGPSVTSGAPAVQPVRECTSCHRTDSPQWRKGPQGPNTLCNSCGLSWARTQRKSEGTHSRPGSSGSGSASPPAHTSAPTLVPPTYHQAVPLPGSAVIPSGAPLHMPSESRARPAPRRLNGGDDEHMRSSSAGSHTAESVKAPLSS
ncbi:hypothetical protein BDV93DRAFT_518735 [Ceratobasidium sp. AG-I]|nr:hypothetical protein BDV93DRAFT_518735 [Ceratobasidium sp. AG-I]